MPLRQAGVADGKGTARCCQTNANQSQFAPKPRNLDGTKLPPFGKCGGSIELEVVSVGEAAFVVEVVVD